MRSGRAPLRAVAALLAALLLGAMDAARAETPTEDGLKAKGARLLTSADFSALYVGNTLSGTASDGESFHVLIADGRAFRMLYKGERSAGTWSVGKDGTFCATSGAETSCTREWLLDGVVHSFIPDGTLAGTARIRPGNPEKL